MYFLLRYEVVEDYVTRRAPLRAEHLALARAAAAAGTLRLGGALEPADEALLVFFGDESVATSFALADPYVRSGIVTRWTVRPWNVVVGADLVDSGR